MPITRASKQRAATDNHATPDDVGDDVSESDTPLIPTAAGNAEGLVNDDEIEVQLESITKRIKQELASLRKQNQDLKREVERLTESEDVSIQPNKGRRGMTASNATSLQVLVKNLRREVHKLENARKKDREQIHQLQEKEIARDAAELQTEGEESVESTDIVHKMRKLLRRFHDAMYENTVAEDEQCAVCYEVMVPPRCSSLQCQHPVCSTCLPQLKGIEKVECPTCRRLTPRDEVETIQYTATQQWDELLEVARKWAKIDKLRGDQETSDEEADEDFVDDGEVEGEKSSEMSEKDLAEEVQVPNPQTADADDEPPPENELPLAAPSTPPHRNTPATYSQSPAEIKRRRMEALVEERNRKKRR